MKIWYISEERFTKKVIKKWQKDGIKYNAGNVNILRYAFRTVQYWSTLKGEHISRQNKVNIDLTIF